MAQKDIGKLRLPSLEQARQKPVRNSVHYLAETPDGEVLSVSESELSEYLRVYGRAHPEEEKTSAEKES